MTSVLTRKEGAVGRLTLNRPEAIHALNLDMCEAMIAALLAWRQDPQVRLVLLDHAGDRGFCAGGDIRMLAESGAEDGVAARAFFRREYQLNALLMAYPKPVVAVMDGVVMGGGVGLSLPCPHRIATERTTFAMPETGIGLFPDVGGGWHLPRLPGAVGMWLALTGARLKAADCRAVAIATALVPTAALAEMKAALLADPDHPGEVIAAFPLDAGPAPLAAHRGVIDAAFGAASVERVIAALAAQTGAFAAEQLRILAAKSPQTLKVAHRELTLGRSRESFEAEMAAEFRIACRVVRRPDFLEGVRAVIIDKDGAPRWRPATLDEVDEALLDEIFAPLPPNEEWRPLEDG